MTQYQPKRSVPRGVFSLSWSMESELSARRSMEDAGVDQWNRTLKFCNDGEEKEIGTIHATRLPTAVSSATKTSVTFWTATMPTWPTSRHCSIISQATSKEMYAMKLEKLGKYRMERSCTFQRFLSYQNFVVLVWGCSWLMMHVAESMIAIP